MSGRRKKRRSDAAPAGPARPSAAPPAPHEPAVPDAIAGRPEDVATAAPDAGPAGGSGPRLPGALVRWAVPLQAAAVFVLVFAVYAASAPRTVALEDDGLFTMSCNVAGVSHPPGYPLHSLLGKLFTLLPVGTVALRVHLLSAFLGALACAVLWILVRALTASRAGAWTAALAFGVSREFWSQSIIAEVYSLNVLLFFLSFLLALRFRERGGRRRLAALAFVVGLGLTDHWPLIVLSGPALVAVVWPRIRELFRLAGWGLLALAVGLLPYAYMVIRSLTSPPISFYGPIHSVHDFFWFVLRKGYSSADRSPTAGVMDQVRFAGFFFSEAAIQFTLAGAALAAVGLVAAWRRLERSMFVALVLAFLGSSLGLILLLHRDYEFMQRAVFKVYPLIPYGAMAIWIGVGTAAGVEFLRARRQWLGLAAGIVVAVALPAATLAAHRTVNMRAGYTWARDYARAVLDNLPPQAILITHGDSDTGPIGYLNHVEHVRPDVDIYNDQGLVFANRLFSTGTPLAERTSRFVALISSTQRPVFYTGDLQLPFGTIGYGLFMQVDRTAPAGQHSVTIDPAQLAFLRRILGEDHPTDLWTADHRNLLLAGFARILAVGVYLGGNEAKSRELRPLLDRVRAGFYGNLAAIEALATRWDPVQLDGWLDQAGRQIDETTARVVLARYHFLRGFVAARRNDVPRAVAAFEASVALQPDMENGAVLNLLRLYAGLGERAKYEALHRKVFGGRRNLPSDVRELDRTMHLEG